MKVVIDPHSGFCPGVISVTRKAEALLDRYGQLYSLGEIVHNEQELSRLAGKGLVTVESISELEPGSRILVRAHGEPPAFYADASARCMEVTDGTCPVVLKLQEDIRNAWKRVRPAGGSVVIFGKIGHAEVLGLVGQTEGDAVVVENISQLGEKIENGEVKAPVELFSQTTKSPDEYVLLQEYLSFRLGQVTVHDTICAQVSGRHRRLREFASSHDVIVFVAGESSSNGKVLYELCKSCNKRTYLAGSASGIDPSWFSPEDTVGVCGATSTPKWLLEEVAAAIENLQ